jgi:Uma2 family endonuclease
MRNFVEKLKAMTTEIIMVRPKVRIPQSKMLTYDDYVRLTPPDSGNYELHNGKIIYMATPIPAHQIFSDNLTAEILVYARKNKLGRAISAPIDTVFTPYDTLQPDILFLGNDRLHLIGNKKIEGAPDLVVEILSPSNTPKEMGYKKLVYEMSDVREYWVVNLVKKTLTQYENVEGEFIMRRVFQETDTLKSLIIEGFETEMSGLFE